MYTHIAVCGCVSVHKKDSDDDDVRGKFLFNPIHYRYLKKCGIKLMYIRSL